MCEKIVYRRLGDLYECVLVHDDGCFEVIGSGSQEEIIQALRSGGLDYVSPALISHNLDSLWKA